MLEHWVRNQQVKGLQGLLIIVGLVLAIVAESFVFQLLAPLIGEGIASLLFWITGALIALWTMRRFVLSYSYTLTGTLLHMTYRYGRYERVLADVYMNSLVAVGTPQSLRERYPQARVNRAVRPGCGIEHFAIAARQDGGIVLYILQPSDEMKKALENAVKSRKK